MPYLKNLQKNLKITDTAFSSICENYIPMKNKRCWLGALFKKVSRKMSQHERVSSSSVKWSKLLQ